MYNKFIFKAAVLNDSKQIIILINIIQILKVQFKVYSF